MLLKVMKDIWISYTVQIISFTLKLSILVLYNIYYLFRFLFTREYFVYNSRST